MAFDLKWTKRASDRLDEIERFIAADRPAAAKREVLRIIERTEQLMGFPLLGHVYRRTREAEYREIGVGNYRVFYVIRADLQVIDVITVWHGARAEPDLP